MSHILRSGGHPVTGSGRSLLLGWSLFLIAGFTLAWHLEPDPRGYGTHQSLGLPPCTFRVLFNVPCPGCGMTTSFSHFVRGDVAQALRANAGGVVLAIVCVLQIPWCWWSAARGRLAGVADPTRFLLILVSVVAGICLLNWIMRLVAG
ncbi:MAG: DUF2752 domain-containing protein [Planctomycetia bacterium]|nr:DUF2752 domain-containing protein [Planctomycetia bacterium]